MAIVTRQIARLGQGACIFEYDYDDKKLYLTAIRCINNGTAPAWGKATMTSTGRSYEATFPAGQTTEYSLPANLTTRLDITVLENGKVDGVDYRLMYPA